MYYTLEIERRGRSEEDNSRITVALESDIEAAIEGVLNRKRWTSNACLGSHHYETFSEQAE